MDASYLTALAALAGSAIGGATSLATTWLSQQGQAKAARHAQDLAAREALYQRFIDEASRLHADALERQLPEMASLVNIHGMISSMRIRSSAPVVRCAGEVARTIVATYMAPNRTVDDLAWLLDGDVVDPLSEFSEACRVELGVFLGG